MNVPWLAEPMVRNLFFTGKGGVGKTSLACASALALAESGRRTLLVSTDPASNLDEVLGTKLGAEPRAVHGVPNLYALNIDPEESARRYRERAVGPYRGLLPEAAIRSMEEGLSGACTTEIAAFDEFTALLSGEGAEDFEHIVFDTAPTGHTLRLLSLPAAWTGFIDTNTTGTTCLGPLSALQKQESQYRASVEVLKDPGQTWIVLVARPDRTSLGEAARAAVELAGIGIRSMRLAVNGVFCPAHPGDPIADALGDRCASALADMPEALRLMPSSEVRLMPTNMVGIAALRQLLANEPLTLIDRALPNVDSLSLAEVADDLEADGHGVVMTMGKGGVGKTTVARQLAHMLAERGHSVLITTTDPAGHAHDSDLPGLRAERIDPAQEVERYTAEVLAAAAGQDAQALALLKEDLRSPCTEEIAVFRAFAEAVARGEREFVVLDTAPTGHTILLLDAAEAYHRDVLRATLEMPESVRQLLPRLRDPAYTKVLLITIPEPTPVHEAQKLQEDLRRAGIEPYGWIVNQSLAKAETDDPVLRAKAAQESGPLVEARSASRRLAVLPWSAQEL